eukprot:749591-Hanusia_phi.AAC.2
MQPMLEMDVLFEMMRKEILEESRIDVFCPPYVAPDHGSVWYKGRQFNDSTSVVPTSRQSIRVGSKMLPVAEQGDIPEGGFVQITCNEHFQVEPLNV